ncbi:hypothetical protein [Pseudomonas purpurea]|uniref:hypothetical protein n=1 Tax=Pseudomonas purpurea TaxID=3136737 RepID=UPI003262E8E5
MKLMVKRSRLVGIIGFPLFLALCVGYFLVFSQNLESYDGVTSFFQLALNAHDHFIYIDALRSIHDSGFQFGLNNDFGIAAIYTVLGDLMPFLVAPDYVLISFIFNCLVLFWCYLFYASVSDRYGLGVLGKLSFFANTYFLYFAQLINKDMLTVCVLLLAVYSALNKRLLLLVLLLPLMGLIRLQLLVFIPIFVFLMLVRRPFAWMILAYLGTSLLAGILTVIAPVIGEESLGEGFSAFVVNFNQNYYVGYVLFNPIRLVQFVMDAYSSFSFVTDSGDIDVAKILRVPQLLVLLLLIKPLLSMGFNYSYWLRSPAKPLVIAVFAFLLAWLMNPTVNVRYVMLITPVLVLFALYARKNNPRITQ